MDLLDVNILLGAYFADTPDHERVHSWLVQALERESPLGLSDNILSGFLRISTLPRAFKVTSDMEAALNFIRSLLNHASVERVRPGPRHLCIFLELCGQPGVRGNLVPDAYLAALALETNCRFVTRDRGFARFKGLRLHDPLAD
ncbi:MAG: type II toxin-antitoxin system VapC family toxin [Opitutales bacterium]